VGFVLELCFVLELSFVTLSGLKELHKHRSQDDHSDHHSQKIGWDIDQHACNERFLMVYCSTLAHQNRL
jgi:hypothetical protein